MRHSFATNISFATVFRQVYLWLTFGLVISTSVAYVLSAYAPSVIRNEWVALGATMIFLVAGIFVAPIAYTTSISTGAFLYCVVACSFGVMASSLCLYYTSTSIGETLLATAIVFGLMTTLGFIVRLDLSQFGSALLMALLGLIAASFINLFFQSSPLEWALTIAGILIFSGLIAYDTQWIKKNAQTLIQRHDVSEEEVVNRIALIGAYRLYLDFINLFMFMLKITGKKR